MNDFQKIKDDFVNSVPRWPRQLNLEDRHTLLCGAFMYLLDTLIERENERLNPEKSDEWAEG